jgi:conjugative relaxase-like TrwC/TraI family protein
LHCGHKSITTATVVPVMSLHKLTAGDGYTYLTRQVAALDATERGTGSLGDYYTEKGESPGHWMGSGLAGLSVGPDGVGVAAAGSRVSEAQMLALFGEGRHPDASAIEEQVIAGGAHPSEALAITRLGNPYLVFEGSTPYRQTVAQRFVAHNVAQGMRGDTPIPEDVRAGIRTDVARDMFTAEFGRAPVDGRELSGFIARGSRQATTAVAGYDLTFSPVKSVSALWASAPREIAAQVEAAHHAAVADTVAWLENNAAFTRLGAGGVRQVDTGGLIGAVFTHRDSRAGDPDLHTHVAISNKVQTRGHAGQPGRWLALDGRVLHKAAVAASERYNTRLEAQLVARLGVRFTDRETGDSSGKRAVREIVGVDPALNTAWSSRRASIEVRRAELVTGFQARHGRAPSAVETLALSQQATLETRAAKHEPRSHAEQRQQWHTEAMAVLGGEPALAAMVHQAVPGTRPEAGTQVTAQWVQDTAAGVLAVVSRSRATWQVDHVRAEAERAARAAGVDLAAVDQAVDAVVSAALATGSSVRLTRATDVNVAEPQMLRRTDGQSVYTVARTQLFTSQAVIDAESRLLTAAHRTDGRTITVEAVGMALLESAANNRELNPGQVALVRELATSGARVQVALAPAGTGKTTALGVLARAWAEGGGSVLGLAPTAAAAAVLGEDLAAPTDTLDKLVHAITAMRDPANADKAVRVPRWVADIGPHTLVVVDEAGMAATGALDVGVDFVLGRGGSVRLVGDDQQLASVSAGGVVRDIADTCGAVTLSHVVRFADPVEGSASLALRIGDTAGIGFYLDHHRVHVGDPATVIDGAYQAWAADRANGLDAVMLAPTRDTVAALNARARADRVDAQATPTGREVTLREGATASAGDLITTRRNDRRLVLTTNDWVRNGDRWHLQDVRGDGSLRVRHLGTGRVIILPTGYVAHHVDLGYARTIHAAQGLTADAAHTVATGAESRQLLYVAMTRGRTHNHLYVQTVGDGDPHTQITPDVLRPPTAVDVLARMVGYDGSQQSATTTARTLTDPTQILAHAAGAYGDALGVAAVTVIGAPALQAIDTAAERVHPGLTRAPAYPTLRAHLAVLTLNGADPERVLSAAGKRELGSATDPAAALDWRLDSTGRHSADHVRTTTGPGPLPWLPPVPAALTANPTWGPYLAARRLQVSTSAAQVAAAAAALTPTTAPLWARPLVGEDVGEDRALLAEVAVWRAATGVDVADRRPTGPEAYRVAEKRQQRTLDDRVQAVLGDPNGAAARWAPLLRTVEPRVLTDPYWPVLADRMAAAERAGINIGALAVTATGLRPLPDELTAAALWWRLAQHLTPSVIEAATSSPARTLRPDWTPTLTTILGQNLAQRVLADPAWPALVTAVDTATHHGWTAPDVLATATELLRSATDTDTPRVRADELTTALVWRVEALLATASTTADDGGTEYLVAPEENDADSGYDIAPENAAPDDADTVLDVELPDGADGVIDQVEGLAAAGTDEDLLSLLGTGPTADDLDDIAFTRTGFGTGLPGGPSGQDTILEAGADWDGALLLELPYTDLPAGEQVTQISADLQAARDMVRSARHQLLTDTSPHLQAVMPMLIAMRTRADELRPVAALDAAAHELWIEAEHAVEAAEHTVATLQRALTDGDAGAGAADDPGPQLASALDLVAYTRQEVTTRRAEWATAHGALLAAAGPEGVITGTDVDQARLIADALDTQALTGRRETVRALEGALVRAENRAAHEHARAELALPVGAATSAVATDTATQPSRAATAVAPDTAVLPDATPDARTAVPGATVAAPAEPGWRRLLGPRPTEPARAARWEQTVAAVTTYRATYNVTSTNPLTPLGSAPTMGSDEALIYRAVTKQWRTTMTSPDTNPGVGEPPSAVTARLAEVERRLAHLRERREARRDHAKDTVTSQDGITDEHGYGHDTGYNAAERNRGSGMGY